MFNNSLVPDDPRARFVIAQVLIEEGRTGEALLLLRDLAEDHPRLWAWVERLERGQIVDTSELSWEPGMVRPMPPRRPIQWQPGRLVIALLMAFSLMLPVLQMFIVSRPADPTPDGQAAVRSAARIRTQRLCEQVITDAIEDGRLLREVGSCMEWSFRLGDRLTRQLMDCHLAAPDDDRAFRVCAFEAGVYPDGVRPPGTNPS